MKPPKVSAAAIRRIWEDDGYRLFLSHKSEVSKEVVRLKHKLKVYGVSAFVAHASIKPTQQWQDEIENGLHSMEALAALITEDFHDSNWTDQEGTSGAKSPWLPRKGAGALVQLGQRGPQNR